MIKSTQIAEDIFLSILSKEPYYKRLIRKYGLWYGPKMTGMIIEEAKNYNLYEKNNKNIKPYWKDIAKDIGISANTMSRIITGKGFPGKETMYKLIKYLDLKE